jgi:hypothetical protein
MISNMNRANSKPPFCDGDHKDDLTGRNQICQAAITSFYRLIDLPSKGLPYPLSKQAAHLDEVERIIDG